MMKELSEENLTLYSRFKITTADTDMFSRVRAGAFVNLLIQSAINSAESLGFGFDELREQRLFWVLSRLTIEINNPLILNHETEVETWPKTIDRLLYTRDFIIRDIEQNIIARATSGWLAIDTQTKKPKIINGLQAEMFVHLKEKHGINELPEKLPTTHEGDSFTVHSGYFDFDLNKHVTSTRYIDWMMDTFPVDFHSNNFPKKISINFMKETLPGDSIHIIRKNNHGLQFCFEGTNLLNKTVAFRGKIDF
ncbi:MAG: acyl-ACP thioesterase domain-containing protein [Lentimicrobiaceae bacterium]|jgi:acyl-ACP thioesterase